MTTIAPSITQEDSALTRGGYERLSDELTALTTTGRAEMRDRLRDARAQGGELSDNLQLIDALEDQELLERRIATLEAALGSARVVDAPADDGTIGIGTRVRLRDVETGRTAQYDLVGSIEVEPGQRMVSSESPVGRALLGRRAGDVVEVIVPRGSRRFELLDVHPDRREDDSASVTSHARASKLAPTRRRIALASPG
jgi:transcription elongation factor GreA